MPGAGNITRHPAYRSYFKESDAFPNADRIMAEGFLLGCHHGTTFAQIDRACELLKAFEANKAKRSRRIHGGGRKVEPEPYTSTYC